MPSILSETLLTLHDAARLLPSNRAGKRVNFATVWRWVLKGVNTLEGNRVRLEAVRVGGRWLTSREALDRFAASLTPSTDTATTNPIRAPSRRRRDISAATKRLNRMGIT